jgi:hypothetical protein
MRHQPLQEGREHRAWQCISDTSEELTSDNAMSNEVRDREDLSRNLGQRGHIPHGEQSVTDLSNQFLILGHDGVKCRLVKQSQP